MAQTPIERRLYCYRNPGDRRAFITRNKRNRISRRVSHEDSP